VRAWRPNRPQIGSIPFASLREAQTNWGKVKYQGTSFTRALSDGPYMGFRVAAALALGERTNSV
jgi:hypothetical protein